MEATGDTGTAIGETFASPHPLPRPSTEFEELRSVQDANLIVTTPEKWDSMTRSWRDNMALMKLVGLVLIDEVHTIGEEKRGQMERKEGGEC